MNNYMEDDEPRRIDVWITRVRRLLGMGIALLLIIAVIAASIGTVQAINQRSTDGNVDIIKTANLCRGHGSITEIAPGVFRVVCQ